MAFNRSGTFLGQACRVSLAPDAMNGLHSRFKSTHSGRGADWAGSHVLPPNEFTGADLRALRRQFKMTQEQFAQEIGVTVSSVNRWSGGLLKPSRLARRAIEQLVQRLQASAS